MAVPNVTIEGGAWGRWEFHALAAELKLPVIADAIGRMAWLWQWCLSKETDVAPARVVDMHLGPGGAAAIVACELGREVEGGILVRGAQERIEQWQARQDGYRKGGRTQASRAHRAGGRFQGLGPEVAQSTAPSNGPDTSTSSPPARHQPAASSEPAQVQLATSLDQPSPSSSPSSSPSPPDPEGEGAEESASSPRRASRRRPAHGLPDGWTPRTEDVVNASPGVNVDRELQRFRDHAAATDRRLVDWNAGFRMWLSKATPERGSPRGPQSPTAIALEELERLRAEERSRP
jgi:hypothetical protein